MPADNELQFRRLGEPLRGHIGGPERLRDNDFGVGQLAIEDRIRTVLIRGHDQRMAIRFEVFAQAQFARHAAEKRAGLEINRFWRWKSLAVWIMIDLGKIVPRVGAWITVNGVIVEHAHNLCHNFLPYIVSLLN
jgi:hypothetical protein